ncbi:cardiolipin synthase (CMP-forming) [Scomber scombrus]|uniref:cardiolipin synthase (CMP-forming) n=1 Tax=Scomber scombrus TaxID=13677 RepID=A0AAV1Q164_SCOSC
MMMCFRRDVRWFVSARSAGALCLEGTSWRHRHTPVTGGSRTVQPPVNGSWIFRLSGTDSRVACTSGILQQLKPTPWHAHGHALLYRGGHERSAASIRSLLSPGARGLCSGKPKETPESPREEDRTEAAPVPGQGLFKFKELLDGYIARTWPTQKSALGSALDPLADKILISILYVSLTYAEIIPAPLTALVIFRDIGLIAAVFWVRYKTVPPPVTLSKFFNPCYTTAQLKPTLFSKVNTAVQLLLVAASLAAPVFHFPDSILLQCLWYITAVTTTVSGYSYWHYGRKTVQVLNRSP